jgi:hypothetical protein
MPLSGAPPHAVVRCAFGGAVEFEDGVDADFPDSLRDRCGLAASNGLALHDIPNDGWCSGTTTYIMRRWPEGGTESDPDLRMGRVAECERIQIRANPIIPLCHDVQLR